MTSMVNTKSFNNAQISMSMNKGRIMIKKCINLLMLLFVLFYTNYTIFVIEDIKDYEQYNSIIQEINKEKETNKAPVPIKFSQVDLIPINGETYYIRGNEYYKTSDYQQARDYFKKAVEQDYKNGKYKIALASAEYEIGNYAEVLKICNELIWLKNNYDVETIKGAELLKNNINKKINEFKEIANKNYNERNYNKAIEYYTKAIQYYPNDSILYYNRGNAYINLKDYSSANADFSQAIKLNPMDKRFYMQKRLAEILTNNSNEVERNIKSTFLELNNDNAKLIPSKIKSRETEEHRQRIKLFKKSNLDKKNYNFYNHNNKKANNMYIDKIISIIIIIGLIYNFYSKKEESIIALIFNMPIMALMCLLQIVFMLLFINVYYIVAPFIILFIIITAIFFKEK